MPLGRYLLFVGAALIAILFLAEPYIPQTADPLGSEARVDTSIIRIKSARKWPEKVVYDTSLPTLVPSSLPPRAEAAFASDGGRGSLAQIIPPKAAFEQPTGKHVKNKLARRSRANRIAGYREPKRTWLPRTAPAPRAFAMTGPRSNPPAAPSDGGGWFSLLALSGGRLRFGG